MTLAEIEAKGPVKPQTPQQMRASSDKQSEANARVTDVRRVNAIRLAAAQRKAAVASSK